MTAEMAAEMLRQEIAFAKANPNLVVGISTDSLQRVHDYIISASPAVASSVPPATR